MTLNFLKKLYKWHIYKSLYKWQQEIFHHLSMCICVYDITLIFSVYKPCSLSSWHISIDPLHHMGTSIAMGTTDAVILFFCVCVCVHACLTMVDSLPAMCCVWLPYCQKI